MGFKEYNRVWTTSLSPGARRITLWNIGFNCKQYVLSQIDVKKHFTRTVTLEAHIDNFM